MVIECPNCKLEHTYRDGIISLSDRCTCGSRYYWRSTMRAAQLLRADGTTVESTSNSDKDENDRDHE